MLSACILANTLPRGRDALALCADKARGDREAFLQSMEMIACLHDWSSVVDISGLPMNRHWLTHATPGTRWQRLRDTVASMRELRQRLAPSFELDPRSRTLGAELDARVGEAYLTCMSHPDVRAFYALFPSAMKAYLPHGMDSLHAAEIEYYEPFCAPQAPRPTARELLLDRLKRLGWGEDAVPVRQAPLHTAYSFNMRAPWAETTVMLTDRLNQEEMRRLFHRLPAEISGYYSGLAAQCSGRTGLVLLFGADGGPGYPYDLELEAYTELVDLLVAREQVDTILVKPHPLNSDEWIGRCSERIVASTPAKRVVLVERYRYLPVELILAPFDVAASASLGSSSQRTLNRIYGIRSYCPAALLRRLFAYSERMSSAIDTWLEDVKTDVILV